MTTKLLLLISFTMLFSTMNTQAQTPESKKILIVYFSQSGNTETIARQIQKAAGGDIFRLETAIPYPEKYQTLVDQAKKEIEAGYKPALKDKAVNPEPYDIIFLGSPSWWSTIAPAVSSFLSAYDFAGKTIIPFITHEGSRMGRAVADIKKLAPGATVLEGLPIRGSSVQSAGPEVHKWIKETLKTLAPRDARQSFFQNTIFPAGEQGASDWFTGTVMVNTLLVPGGNLDYTIGDVKFEPGARTRWHTHPIEQVLLVTEGKGFYQEKGKPARPIRKGDVVVIPPDAEHWHGAAPDTGLIHIAITNYKNGSNVVWLDAVSDLEYGDISR